jgi:hypothetical protein
MSANEYVLGASMRWGAPVHRAASWHGLEVVTVCGRRLFYPAATSAPDELSLCRRCANVDKETGR